jgi:uncharacterized delta-60 repeat protein
MGWRLIVCIACMACGRINFDPIGGDDDDGGAPVRGILDPTWGTDGVVTYDYVRADSTTQDDFATGIAIDSAGRIVVAGDGAYTYRVPGDQMQMAALTLRLLPDGTFDASYQNGATSVPGVTADTSGFWSRGQGVIVDASDAIVLCGYREWGGTDDPTAYRYLAVGGQSDPTFGMQGITHVATPGEDDTEACARDPKTGDYVLVGGNNGAQTMFTLALSPSGAPDPAFAGGNLVTYDGPGFDRAFGAAVDSSGAIYLAGVTNGASMSAWRFLGTGTLDPSFGSGGRVDTVGNAATGYGLAIRSGGLVVIGTYNSPHDVIAVALDPSGASNSAFGSAGVFTYDSGQGMSIDEAHGIAIDGDGSIYLAGSVGAATVATAMAVWKLTPNGTLDPAFGTGGVLVTAGPQGLAAKAAAIALDKQHRPVVAGTVLNSAGNWDIAIWRLQ